MSVVLARWPLTLPIGKVLFAVICDFGVAIIVFALSTHLILSLAALAVMGGADVVSVVIRFSLVQLRTPAEMRGRVSAVNGMFTGTSNYLGDFRAGAVAAAIGAVPAVLIGGVGVFAIMALWMFLFPQLWRIRTYEDLSAAQVLSAEGAERGREQAVMTAVASTMPARACRPSPSPATRAACGSTASSRRGFRGCRSPISSASSAKARCA